ncbi:MAG: hypothetical protein M3253_05970 [Chloroflexota bacterium]|nr:hypothetical protein [Chloroflexota bacterium]
MLAAALTLLVACAGAPPSSPPTATPTPGVTPSPAPTPGAGFYLRAWQSAAGGPRDATPWPPVLTISGDQAIEGNVAVPAIYPGPLLIVPNVRPITDDGVRIITNEAQQLGLLGERGDFTVEQRAEVPRANIVLVLDGVTHELVGEPWLDMRCDAAGRCEAEPGTPEAFASFFSRLGDLSWLGTDVGPTSMYEPERLAVLVIPPQQAEPGIRPQLQPWPLETPLPEFGEPVDGDQARCAIVSGDELDALLPALLGANQLTRFVDDQGDIASLVVRVLVPGEPDDCHS